MRFAALLTVGNITQADRLILPNESDRRNSPSVAGKNAERPEPFQTRLGMTTRLVVHSPQQIQTTNTRVYDDPIFGFNDRVHFVGF